MAFYVRPELSDRAYFVDADGAGGRWLAMAVENIEAVPPKLFISYSWTDQPHMDWVMQLATDLRRYGVESIIDRWHLKEGQDAHSFMEQMVRADEVNKAVLVCDRNYVERANKREGGVGAESQIITSEIFGNVQQTKFVAVALSSDEDGGALLPIFMGGRIYIDFRNSDEYSERLQQLVRWAYDQPLYNEPDVGPRPKFLDEQVNFQPVEIRPDRRSITTSPEAALVGFFEEASERNADFTVQMTADEPNDETVFQAILSLPPIIAQVIAVVKDRLISHDLSDVELDSIVRYLEAIFANYNKGSTKWSADVTKFYGQFLYPAVLSQMVRLRRFATAGKLMRSRILHRHQGGVTADALPLLRMSRNIDSLEGRNSRLSLNRASIHSDLIKQTCELVNIDFTEFMQAEFIIYLQTALEHTGYCWWPDSNLYAADSHGAYPWFARATVSPYREHIMGLIGPRSREEVESLIDGLKTERIPQVRWRSAFSTLPSIQLGNFKEIAESF